MLLLAHQCAISPSHDIANDMAPIASRQPTLYGFDVVVAVEFVCAMDKSLARLNFVCRGSLFYRFEKGRLNSTLLDNLNIVTLFVAMPVAWHGDRDSFKLILLSFRQVSLLISFEVKKNH